MKKLTPLIGILIGSWLFLNWFHPLGIMAPKGAKGKEVAYAMRQLGKPYLWGGNGPGAFDCSGLSQHAYMAADISIPRTAAEQWAAGPRTYHPEPGDLVFFAGALGTPSAPGHVGIYLAPHKMIDAYATGTTIRIESFGLPSSAGGLQDVVGYTDPR